MATTTGCCRENKGLGEIQIKERKGEVQRGSREGWSMATATFTVYPSSGDDPRARQPREGDGVFSLVLWVERRGAGERMASRGRFWPFQTSALSLVYVGSSVRDWAAGRCVLDGVVGCVYGCGRWCRWLNVAVGNKPGSECVHA
jgi:hypothetical protein